MPAPRSISRSFGAGWASSAPRLRWACTRRTSRRSATAGGSCSRVRAEVLEAGLGRCRRTTAAFLSGVTSSDSILPTLTPGDLHVLARDDGEGVRRRSRAPGSRRRRRRRPCRRRPARRRRGATAAMASDALHGPGGTMAGIAVQSAVGVAEGRRAVRAAAWRRGARAAAELAGLQAGRPLGGRERRQRAAGRVRR